MSLSCLPQLNQNKTMRPQTATHDSQGFTITRNIKNIVRKQDKRLLSASNKVFNQLINQQPQQLTTQVVEEILEHDDNKTILSQAIGYDQRIEKKKKTSYHVQSKRKQQPQHILGYNTIDLQQSKKSQMNKPILDLSKVQSPFLTTISNAEQIVQKQLNLREPSNYIQPYEKHNGFLPLEYYLMENEQGLAQVQGEDGNIQGYSKWYDNNGQFVWKTCIVNSYDEQSERYRITWTHNNKEKIVGRVNLRFEQESISSYDKMIQEAQKVRQQSEVFLKYNQQIDYFQSSQELRNIPQHQKDKIFQMTIGVTCNVRKVRDPLLFFRLDRHLKYDCKNNMAIKIQLKRPKDITQAFIQKGYDLNYLNRLDQESNQQFKRANKQCEFNYQLAFDKNKQNTFKGFLKDELFVPVSGQPSKETNSIGVIQVDFGQEVGVEHFQRLFKKMKTLLHQAQERKMLTLLELKLSIIQFSNSCFFMQKFDKVYDLDTYHKSQTGIQQEVFREFKSKLFFDFFYMIDEMIIKETQQNKKRNEELMKKFVLESDKKQIQQKQLSDSVENSLSRFQKLVNTFLERAIRNCYEKSIAIYISSYEIILQKFRKELKMQADEIIDVENGNFEQIHKFQKIIQFEKLDKTRPLIEIKLVFEAVANQKETTHQLKYQPSMEEYKKVVLGLEEKVIKNLKDLQCLDNQIIRLAREDGKLQVFLKEETTTTENRTALEQVIDEIMVFPQSFFEKVLTFQPLANIQVEQLKRKYRKIKNNDFDLEIDEINNQKQEIKRVLNQEKINIGPFLIDCSQVIQQLEARKKEQDQVISEVLTDRINQETEKLNKKIKELLKKLKEIPNNIEELDELQQFIKKNLEEEVYQLKRKIKSTMHMIELLEKIGFKYQYDLLTKVWECYGLPMKVVTRKEKCLKKLQLQEKKFNNDLNQQQGDLALEIKNIQMDLDYLMNLGDIEQYDKNSNHFFQIGERIENAQKDSEVVNRRQRILKYQETEYLDIGKLKCQWLPYNKVWELCNNVQQTIPQQLTRQLNNIDREEFTNYIMSSWQELVRLEKGVFKNIHHMLEITTTTKQMYNKYRPYLSLINDLLNPNLKGRLRCWKQIKTVLADMDITQDLNVTFDQLLKQGVMEVKDQIRDISEIASKEQSFEKVILKMKQEWKQMKFETGLFRDTDTYILKDLEPIQDKLDEDITKVLSIASSPYVKFIDIASWKTQLQRAQDIIEQWVKVQKLWQYLQPIFYSDDIIRQMPVEGNKYSQVDKLFNTIMAATVLTPTVLEACSYNKLREYFDQSLDTLDQVQKGLNDYLQTKRAAFPRFYFLSSEELLSILAQTRDPEAVQPHLQKCFEGIESLRFYNKTRISHMQSKMNEVVELNRQVEVLNKKGEQRGVEEWLQEVEDVMKSTLEQSFNYALEQYHKVSRKQWLFNHPAQVAVTGERVIWTNSVQEALINKTLQQYGQQLEKELLEIVEMVRQKQDYVKRQTLGTLIILEVHAKDVVQQMVFRGVDDRQSFEWLAQMRYYRQENKKVIIEMVSTSRSYGYEYLGNQDRLVITPLTDRCYRTLMSALAMNLGGSPEGPAGTGKTETVKDLSKQLAKHCQVFNCQDELDINMMARFFKGLVSCGSWSCFDEFNRIELEVLSVIASQVLAIQNAVLKESSRNKKKTNVKTTFLFEGTSINLDPSCAIFTTMNPGYAGRSVLPDNLKALFRPVAMMVPNYTLIAQIQLYSFGFENAPDLSLKIQQSLKLASEQVSSQKHYDFGMRAVKSILTAAGNLKREHIDQDESELVLKAIIDITVPKFTSKDVPLFMDIVSDLFPQTINQVIFDNQLMECIENQAEIKHNTLNDYLTQKLRELYQMFQIRHGLMVVGQTLSAKSSIIDTLSKAITQHNYDQAYVNFLEFKQQKQMQILEEQQQEQKNIDIVQQYSSTTIRQSSSFEDEKLLLQLQQIDKEITDSQEKQKIIQQEIDQENSRIQYQKVKIKQMNPKSVTIKNMYGFNDEASNEFREGVAARLFRQFADETTNDFNWILFDGPVDANWIENLNTVLDDNKKLCLPNGETIRLTDTMSIFFEVEDLVEASPATVSRCGMVFMECNGLDYQALLKRWLNLLPKSVVDTYHNHSYQSGIEMFIPIILDISFNNNNNLFALNNVSQQWLIISFLKVLETQILDGKTQKQIIDEELQEQERQRQIEESMRFISRQDSKIVKQSNSNSNANNNKNTKQQNQNKMIKAIGDIIYSIIWSFGIMVDEKERKVFQQIFKERVYKVIDQIESLDENQRERLKMNEECEIYDFFFNNSKLCWEQFIIGKKQNLDQSVKFSDIYIETNESLRHDYIISRLLDNGNCILMLGKTGSGKTSQIKKYLSQSRERVIGTTTSFTATTGCEQALSIFESKIEKQKRRKGVYGPMIDFKNVIFVDDLNMPFKRKEDYGAQPAIELIRQWMDQEGWYDPKSLDFKTITDIQFGCAMGIGRSPITNRLLRHFNTIYATQFSQHTLFTIINTILEWGFHSYIDSVKLQTHNFSTLIVNSFIKVQSTFLPLPKKTHYLFNLRDVLKILQGILEVGNNEYSAMRDTRQDLLDILIFESKRVYADRLIDEKDQEVFNEIMTGQIMDIYQQEVDIQEQIQISYGNYLNHDMNYQKINNQTVDDKINKYIFDYNDINKKQIEIVLFEDSKILLCKINRIISQVYGNGLLIGIGGIGRKTMTRLACFIQDYIMYDLEDKEINSIQDWQEQCKEIIKQVGVMGQKMVLLINDSELKYEKMLEDINSLLNTGEIPSLFQGEEKEVILSELKEIVQKNEKQTQHLDQQSLYDLLIEKTQANLHIVLCLSPIGDSLRNRFNNYPSLISSTTLVYNQPWSQVALFAVAQHFLSQSGLQDNLTGIAQVCVDFHMTVRQQTQEYFHQEGKYYYVTPMSYKILLGNFQETYTSKMKSLVNSRNTYVQGVQKLEDCNLLVSEMKQMQEDLKPVLEDKSQKTEEIMKIIEVEAEEAERQKEIVSKDEEITAENAGVAENIAVECKDKLSIAEPDLEAAEKLLKGLQTSHFVELKNLLKPVNAVKQTLIALYIMIDPKIAKGQYGKEDEYLGKAKKALENHKALKEKLQKYDKDNISEKTVKKMEIFLAKNLDFNKESVGTASVAASGICKWIFAILNYYKVFQSILPLRVELEGANKKLQEATDELSRKRQILQDIEDKIKGLNDKFENENFEKQKLLAEIDNCKKKTTRALRLTSGLVSERESWIISGEEMGKQIETALGDILISVGFISYLGAFTDKYRHKIVTNDWIPIVTQQNILVSHDFSLQRTITDDVQVQNWILNSLPNNEVSIQNAIIMQQTNQYPLIIDPQNQALKYILKSNAEVQTCKVGKEMYKYVEMSVRMGKVLILQNVGEVLDSMLDNILSKNIENKNSFQAVQMGANMIEYDSRFRLFLITKNPNPHYSPDTLNKITLINFSITRDGLKDQLLSIIAKEEEPKDEEEKVKILIENSENNIRKKEIETRILKMIQETEGSKMLDSETLIQQLTQSKQTSVEIQQKLQSSKITEERINLNRQNYDGIAKVGSHIYFMIMQLLAVDPMYDFSLEFFIRLFKKAINKAEKPAQKNIKQRVDNIHEQLKRQTYYEIGRSIFVKHKLLFSFMMTICMLEMNSFLPQNEQKILTTGVGDSVLEDDNRVIPHYITNKSWDIIRHLSQSVEVFNGLDISIYNNQQEWAQYSKSLDSHMKLQKIVTEQQQKQQQKVVEQQQEEERRKMNNKPQRGKPKQQQTKTEVIEFDTKILQIYHTNTPDEKYQNLTDIQHLLLLSTLRPELFIDKLKIVITNELGNYFITNEIIPLEDSFKESSSSIPLMFVLSAGDDPQEEVRKFAQDKGKLLIPISLGKGQGEMAKRHILECSQLGNWVLLQNCHLARTWLNELEELAEQFGESSEKKGHSDFRLWLTTSSTHDFPRYLLQESVKMTKDPPKGIKSNVLQLYKNIQSSKTEKAIWESSDKQEEWQKLFMGLCFFHAIVRERRRFGPIGWNNYYEFNDADLKISMKQLQVMLRDYQSIPFEALNYLTGECYYGGRVTDEWDFRLLQVILQSFYNQDFLYISDVRFSPVQDYYVPENMSLDKAIDFLSSLEDLSSPELFGLHSNASFQASQFETNQLLTDLVMTARKQSSTNNDQIEQMRGICKEIIGQLPDIFDYEDVQMKNPIQYNNSMNTVLIQEVLRYNALLNTVNSSLNQLLLGLSGQISISAQSEETINFLQQNQVPLEWLKSSYPSNKPLVSYIKDLSKRVQFYQQWISNGMPKVFWMPGFYFTQSFLTGILQTHARSYKVPIDLLKFNFAVIEKSIEEIENVPEKGCYVHGLYLDGARWDSSKSQLDDHNSNAIYHKMPIIQLIPVDHVSQIIANDEKAKHYVYDCPLYKTSVRKGELLTTGNSTNFILTVKLKAAHKWQHWTKRGVALLTQLDD